MLISPEIRKIMAKEHQLTVLIWGELIDFDSQIIFSSMQKKMVTNSLNRALFEKKSMVYVHETFLVILRFI